jgi:hypothetical protein
MPLPSESLSDDLNQSQVEAAKYDVGQTDLSSEHLATVDADLPELPDGYGEARIVLMSRDAQWAYVYWDVPNEQREPLRQQGGQQLGLRLYDVTEIDLNQYRPHSVQQYAIDEFAHHWYMPIPVSDRDYIAEIGYVTGTGHWLSLARSNTVRIPPVYPSDWVDNQFATIAWEEELRGKHIGTLVSPDRTPGGTMHEQMFAVSQPDAAQRLDGSMFGSMQQLPTSAISSFVFPSGMGLWAAPTVSGMGLWSFPSASGVAGWGLPTPSGMGLSGMGWSASAPPVRSRRFWLLGDAELIVYGATEPDATVTIGGEPIQLNPDGTFRLQMSFQDGVLNFPIMAVAEDGEQMRQIQLRFVRETPHRNTNAPNEAPEEWL